MGCTWQPLCFIRLQQLLIRLRRAQIGASHSCPEPQPVRGGGGCCGLCCCRLELLGGEWCLGFSVYCKVLAPQNPRPGLGVRLSSPLCSGEGSVTPGSFLARAQQHTELPPSARRVSQGLCTTLGLGYRHLIPLPPSQTKSSPSGSAPGAQQPFFTGTF